MLGLQRVSPALQQLRQLASNPMELLRSKRCELHIVATYFPLSEQEIAAVAREAGRQQRGERGPLRASSSTLGSARMANMLHR